MAEKIDNTPFSREVLFSHTVDIYETMRSEAEVKTIFEEDHLVWEGFLTKLFRRAGKSVPLYSHVMNELKKMDCVRQLRRGGGTTTSVWILVKAPTPELFNDAQEVHLLKKNGQPRRHALEVMQQQVNDLRRYVNSLEDRIAALEGKEANYDAV